MKRSLLVSLCLASGHLLYAQPLQTVTGLTLFEHHSSSINNNAPFGSSANGSKSAYDFVNRTYFNSFNTSNFGAYTNGEEANIDMVEHNSVFGSSAGNPLKFGITSGVSTIWSGDIKGNNTTVWMEAPASFNYATATNVSHITAAFNQATATKSIAEIKEGKVYLGRIRNTALYVAMRCTNVKNATAPGGIKDVSFDFEYKYGVKATTSVGNEENNSALLIFPNPASERVVLKNTLQQPFTAKILSVNGQEIRSFSMKGDETKAIDLRDLSNGMYFILCIAEDGRRYVHRFSKEA